MPRVKIEDLDPQARELDIKEMKKLFGGLGLVRVSPDGTAQVSFAGISSQNDADKGLFDGTTAAFGDASFPKTQGVTKFTKLT